MVEDFWEKYPSRNGKKLLKADAKGFFLKNIKDEEFSLLMQAVGNYTVSKTVQDGYAKDAIRFLRKDYWRSWIEPELPPTQSNVKVAYGMQRTFKSVGATNYEESDSH